MFKQQLQTRPFLFQDCYLYFPQPDEIQQQFDKVKVRKIFEGHIQFDQQELQQLRDFDSYLQQKHFTQKTTEAFRLRMLYATKFKFDKTLQAMQAYHNWRSTCFPIRDSPEATGFLENGAIYVHGRDNRFRPIIIVDAAKLAQNKNIEVILDAMTVFLEKMLETFMLPGQIENWVVIMNLGGLGLTSLPRQQLQRVMEYLSNNYRSRMHKCYVINSPSTITISWGIIKGFLEEITVRKISFEKGSIPTGLFQHCHPSQIEMKFGGQCPNARAYWQLVCIYQSQRPPVEVSEEYFLPADKGILISRSKYVELFNTGKLAKNTLCKDILGDIRQSGHTQKSSAGFLKEQFSDEEEEKIGALINESKNFYQPQSITQSNAADEWILLPDSTITPPRCSNFNARRVQFR